MSEPLAAVPQSVEFGIRPWDRQREEAFIFETWLKGAKLNTHEGRSVRDSVFYPARHRLIEAVLERGAKVLVAHPAADEDTILGVLVYEDEGRERPVLHWAFVKTPWRRLGVATRLTLAAVDDPNRCLYSVKTVWHLSIPVPKQTPRADVRAAREKAKREAEARGAGGGDTSDLVRRWPGLTYSPDALFGV